MLVWLLEVMNAWLLWKKFKPGQDVCDASRFRRRSTFTLPQHHARLIEKEESFGIARLRKLGIGEVPEHYLVQTPKGGNINSRNCNILWQEEWLIMCLFPFGWRGHEPQRCKGSL